MTDRYLRYSVYTPAPFSLLSLSRGSPAGAGGKAPTPPALPGGVKVFRQEEKEQESLAKLEG